MPKNGSETQLYLLVSGCKVIHDFGRLEGDRIERVVPGFLEAGDISAEDVELSDRLEDGKEAGAASAVVIVLNEGTGPAVEHSGRIVPVEGLHLALLVDKFEQVLGRVIEGVPGALLQNVRTVSEDVRDIVVVEGTHVLSVGVDAATAAEHVLVVELFSDGIEQTDQAVAEMLLEDTTVVADSVAGSASHVTSIN